MPEGLSDMEADWDGVVIDTGRMEMRPLGVDSRGVG